MSLKSVPTFHDSRYLYTGLLAYSNGTKELSLADLEARVRGLIQDYVAQQQRKYLLAERSATYQKIPSYVIAELASYGLLEKSDATRVRLTGEGSKLRELLIKRQGLQVRLELAASYISNFSKAEYFLRRVWELEASGGLRVPEVTYGSLGPLRQLGSEALPGILRNVADEISAALRREEKLAFVGEAFITQCLNGLKGCDWRREPKQKLFQAVRRAVDGYMLDVTFPGRDISRPKYDTLRDRADSFGLINRRRIEGKYLVWEHTYLVSWLAPPMGPPAFIVPDDLLSAAADGARLQIHEPKWESIRGRFVLAVREAYARLKTPVGYARVADVRESVCFALRLSDRTFDDFIKRLDQEGQPTLTFGIAPERYTIKSLPLSLAEGKTYNLVRIS